MGSFLLLNEEMDGGENYIVCQSAYQDIPDEWVMNVFKTPYGNMYHHTIGLIDDEKNNNKADMFLRLIDGLKLIKTDAVLR